MKSRLIKNIITGFGGQFIAIILGLIVPRLIITSYGSDVNGLLSTITQIFTYMALLEAGIGQAAKNELYKPVAEKNKEETINILSVATTYYRKLSLLYGSAVVALAIVLPFCIKTNVNYSTIFMIVIFEGLSGVFSFYFVETPSILLVVDGRSYVNNTITMINKIVGYAVKIIMALLGINIVFLQFVYFLITIVKVIFYRSYINKKYKWLKIKKGGNNDKLKDRKAYIITEIAWTIFSSTDMIVLSTFLSTQISSVYSIYNMVFINLNVLLNAVFYSVSYLIGYTYHEDINKYEKLHDSLTSIFLGMMTVLMSISYLLIIPFITLYTKGVNDINYIYNLLPLMFCLIQILSWSRYVGGQLTGIAGYAKQTSIVSIIEALINITLSIIFVNKFGIVGVTMATVVALPLKVIWCIYISDKKVMKRSYWKSISVLGINYIYFATVVFTSKYITLKITSYYSFLVYGIVISVILGSIGLGLNIFVNRDCWKIIRKYILKR